MAEIPVSSTQKRLLALLEKESDGTYSHAARLLKEMGLSGNGCPEGMNWRGVKKLSDEEYLAKFDLESIDTEVDVETTEEKRKREDREYLDRKKEYKEVKKERRALNDALYQNGYRWHEVDEENLDSFAGWPGLKHLEGWYLTSPEGKSVSIDEAKKAIGWRD